MEDRKPMTHVTAGLLLAGLLVVYSIVVNFLNLTNTPGMSILQYIIIIGGLIYVINQYGKANDYHESFGNLFAYGFKATAVFTIIFIAFLVIFFLIFPDLKEKTFEMARQNLEAQKRLSDEDIDKAIAMSKKFFWIGVVGGTMLFFIIVGAIGSAIGAAVTKKVPYNPLEDESQIDQLSV